MKYTAICIVVLLFSLCVSQEETVKESQDVSVTPLVTGPPIPHEVLKDIITDYFQALNQRDMSTVTSLTHPYYIQDVGPFLDYVIDNNLLFDIVSISFLMDEEEFREMTEILSDEEFQEQVGSRGVSYEVELHVTMDAEVYEGFYLFIELGETESGWYILDPALLQLVIEGTLEVYQSGG
ncbi:MAG: hypothetical protein HXS47_02200 [Theionarchaea archaeon]|nr:hypothetical protein [Theionarchaea archaeon]